MRVPFPLVSVLITEIMTIKKVIITVLTFPIGKSRILVHRANNQLLLVGFKMFIVSLILTVKGLGCLVLMALSIPI